MSFKLNQETSERKFFKRNYVDVLEILTPKVYFNEDTTLSGLDYSPLDVIIESHINLAKNINSVFNISAVGKGSQFSTFSGTSQFFIKQNNLTNVTVQEFQKKILDPLGYSLKDFAGVSAFKEFVDTTLLPNIRLNKPNYLFGLGSASAAHDYLISNLSWMYILNTSANGGLTYSPSTIVSDRLVNELYYSNPITLNEALKDVTTYIWRNYNVCSLFGNKQLIPSVYLSGTGKYVSGTQQLDKLHTLIDVLYSPLLSDSTDYRIRDAFELYNTTQTVSKEKVIAGPFTKFLTAISYSLYDVNNQINNLNLLYDIDRCPEEYLPRIADLISWELIGNNPDKWRIQLKNAINIYKSKGTKKGLELVLQSTFGETSFALSSQIEELYESYIPNLLYYCLSTESSALSNFSTWTIERSQALGIPNYSPNDMDTNVRFVVDSIIYQAYLLYPQNFYVGNVPFDANGRFSYRNVINVLPPWELEKYYRYCRLDKRLVNYFVDRLLCFGVSVDVVVAFQNLILENTLDSQSSLSTNNNWLIFTPSSLTPPNRNDILSNFKKDKVKYLPLWSGKSSSFNLALQASSFDFNKYSNDIFTSEGLKSIFRSVYEFTPAHAIPLISVGLEDTDTADYDEYNSIKINYSPSADIFTASTFNSGFVRLGSNMSSLGRTFSRSQVDEITDFSDVALSSVNRTNIRRRNYKNLLPKSGWYDRTGFNMPGYLAPSSVKNYDTYKPLGYIPSSNKFTPIATYQSWLYDNLSLITIPEVYDRCEDLRSLNTYNGVATSSTFPIRGASSITDDSYFRYSTRSDCNPIIPLIHSKFLQRAEQQVASSIGTQVTNFYGLDPTVYNVIQSVVNSSLDTLPNSKQNFFDFEFGRDLHQLYFSYINDFGYHDLTRDSRRDNGGFNLFSHSFGPGLFNGELTVDGSAAIAYPALFTSSFGSETKLDSTSLFRNSAAASLSGTYVASTAADFYIDRFELRNPHLLSGVEFIIPSGSNTNYFSIFKIDPIYETENLEDFAIDNTLIKVRTWFNNVGLHRLKFNLKKYGPTQNKLIPDHEFNLNIPHFIGRNTGTSYGGAAIHTWIHTEPENGYVWSWSPNYKWVINRVSDLTPAYIKNNLVHVLNTPIIPVDPETIGSVCAEQTQTLLSLRNIKASQFNVQSIYFNTLNRPICIPNYYNNGQQIHRLDQSYSIDIMMSPNDTTGEQYMLIDKVLLQDTTLNGFTLGYTEEEIQKIFLFFRDTMRGLGSRTASITSTDLGTSGGSRTEYRYHPKFGSTTEAASTTAYTLIDIRR